MTIHSKQAALHAIVRRLSDVALALGSAAVVFGVQNLRYPAAVAPPVKMDMKWYDGIKKPR